MIRFESLFSINLHPKHGFIPKGKHMLDTSWGKSWKFLEFSFMKVFNKLGSIEGNIEHWGWPQGEIKLSEFSIIDVNLMGKANPDINIPIQKVS